MAFEKAVRENLFLRLALMGVPGAGKTMTALAIAQGLAPYSIAVIDTEARSASKYAHLYSFDTQNMTNPTTDNMTKAVNEAARLGYKVLIIDSASHQWLSLVDEVGKLGRSDFSGNNWAAWSKGRPKQNTFMRAILDYPGHVIVTLRVSTEWGMELDAKGKQKPVRIGLKPIAERNAEYEFDMVMLMDSDNTGKVLKDRTGKFQGCEIEKPGPEFGEMLKAWLDTGEARKPTPPAQAEAGSAGNSAPRKKPFIASADSVRHMVKLFGEMQIVGISQDETLAYVALTCGSDQLRDMQQEQFDCCISNTVQLLEKVGAAYDRVAQSPADGLSEDEHTQAALDAARAIYVEVMASLSFEAAVA